jgi:hypothetical protein
MGVWDSRSESSVEVMASHVSRGCGGDGVEYGSLTSLLLVSALAYPEYRVFSRPPKGLLELHAGGDSCLVAANALREGWGTLVGG